MVTKRFHPFAKHFGKLIRDEMTRLYNEDKDPDQTHAKSVCRPLISALRRASGNRPLCDKWMATGRCKLDTCNMQHPDWPVEWDGAWLHQNCNELATMAKVPKTWRPT